MPFSLYDVAIFQAKSALLSLRQILEQGQKQDPERKFLEARIYESMRPLTFQVAAATMFSEQMMARLTGIEEEPYVGNFESYDALYKHIDHVVQRLDQADKATVNASEDKIVSLTLPSGTEHHVPAHAHATGWALPHIFFHVTTAYDILRMEGVPLAKRDYIAAFLQPHLPTN